MGRYKLIVEGAQMESQDSESNSLHKDGVLNHLPNKHHSNGGAQTDGEILLDLSTPEDAPSNQGTTSLVNKDLQNIGKVSTTSLSQFWWMFVWVDSDNLLSREPDSFTLTNLATTSWFISVWSSGFTEVCDELMNHHWKLL